mgnify:CR=1 FL=1
MDSITEAKQVIATEQTADNSERKWEDELLEIDAPLDNDKDKDKNDDVRASRVRKPAGTYLEMHHGSQPKPERMAKKGRPIKEPPTTPTTVTEIDRRNVINQEIPHETLTEELKKSKQKTQTIFMPGSNVKTKT